MLFHYPISGFYFYAQAVDMRSGIDSLCGIIINAEIKSAYSTCVFIFMNKRKNQLKMLHWQGDGFAVFYKRLEKGTFEVLSDGHISSEQVLFLLQGVVQKTVRKKSRFEHNFVIN